METKGTRFLRSLVAGWIEDHDTKHDSDPPKALHHMWMLQVYAHDDCTYENIHEIARIMVEIDVACAGETSMNYDLLNAFRTILPRLYEALGMGDIEVDSDQDDEQREHLIIKPDIDDNPMFGFDSYLTDYIESEANREPRTQDDGDNNIPLLSQTDIATYYCWTLNKAQVERLLRKHKDINGLPYKTHDNGRQFVSIYGTVKERDGEKYISIYDYEDGYRMALDAGYGDELIAAAMVHLQQEAKI